MPAIIAIVLALVTKQVYISLFLGIFIGALMYAGGDPLQAFFTLYQVMSEKIGANTPIIVFLVVLGIFVVLMQKSGGAKAYGDWAGKKIKSKSGALAATAGLGCLIFVDDYFNCLTVGSVMRPVTDKFKISRAKLSYIIDATAAPVCIIAPISSWAAAVAGELDGDGLIKRGVIVRHLVLPSHRRDSMAVLDTIADTLPISDVKLSLMSQYTPDFALDTEFKNLHRRVTSFEYSSVLDYAISLGFDGYFQERTSASESFTPNFKDGDMLAGL
jgi:hypothetical protein